MEGLVHGLLKFVLGPGVDLVVLLEQGAVYHSVNLQPLSRCAWFQALRSLRSVDVELVAFRVLHPDRIVVESFLGQRASNGRTEADQSAGLRVDSLPASLDRVRPLATGVDVEVQAVLDDPGIRDDMEPDARPVAVRVADPVRPLNQLVLGYPELAVEVVPAGESIRDRREFIAERDCADPDRLARVGAVDDELKADRHRFPPQAARPTADILPDRSSTRPGRDVISRARAVRPASGCFRGSASRQKLWRPADRYHAVTRRTRRPPP